MNNYDVVAEIKADLKGYTGKLDDAAKQMNKFSSVVDKSSGRAEKSTSTFGKLKSALSFGAIAGAGAKAFGMISGAVGSLISDLSDSTATWATFTGNMKQMGASSKEIAKVKKELQSYAQATIYSASDMASTYSQLAAVGTKNTTQLVKGFGGLAAASENPKQAMKSLSQQATQMAAKPKVAWEDFKIMLEQSPAGMAAVAKTMGMSMGQMIAKIQDGKLSTNDFFKAVEKTGNSKAFQNMATQYKTVGQAMDGLKEGLVNQLQPAFARVSQYGIKAISGLSDYISKINFNKVVDGAMSAAAGLINFFKPAFSQIQTLWMNLQAAFGQISSSGALKGIAPIFSGIGSVIKTVISVVLSLANVALSRVIDIVHNVGAAFGKVFSGSDTTKIFGTISQAFQTFGNVAMTVIGQVGGVIAGLDWVSIFQTVKVVWESLVNVLSVISKAIESAFNNDIIRSFGAAVLAGAAAFKAFSVINGIVTAIKSFSIITKATTAIQAAFNAVLAANPFVLVGIAIAAAVAGLVYFFTQTKTGQALWQSFVSFLSNAWESLKTTATNVWNTITTAVTNAVTGVQNAWNGITTFFSNLWTGITSAASAAWTGFTATLSAIWSTITTTASTAFTALGAFFGTIWNGIITVATAVWNTFGTSITAIWNGIVTIAKGVWNLLKSVIMGPILIVIDLLTGSWKQVGADLSLIWNSIKDAAIQIWNGLKTYFSGVLSFWKALFSSVWKAISSALSAIWGAIVSTGKSLWNGFKSFMSSLWNAVKSATSAAWNGIKTAVSSITSGTISGAKSAWNGFKSFMSALWSGIKSTASAAWNGLKSTVISIAHAIYNGAKAAWSGFTGMVRGIVNGVKGAFNALRNINLLAAGKAIINSFFNGLISAYSKVKGFISGIGDWIRKHKGPISYDRKLLIPAGNAIMNGLNSGLKDQFGSVQKNVSGMANAIAAAATPSISMGDIAGTINSANRKLNEGMTASVQGQLSVSQRPLNVSMNVNGTEWRGFVADITNTQDVQLQLQS